MIGAFIGGFILGGVAGILALAFGIAASGRFDNHDEP